MGDAGQHVLTIYGPGKKNIADFPELMVIECMM